MVQAVIRRSRLAPEKREHNLHRLRAWLSLMEMFQRKFECGSLSPGRELDVVSVLSGAS
jgi:hypothetical protein